MWNVIKYVKNNYEDVKEAVSIVVVVAITVAFPIFMMMALKTKLGI